MALSPINKLLQQIQSDDEETFYIAITQKAMEWMTAGFVAEANALLEVLWSQNIPHTRNVGWSDKALLVMWKVSNQYPSRIPFEQKNIKQIEIENWERNIEQNQLFNDTLDNYKFNIADENYDDPGNTKPVLKALEKYLKDDEPAGSAYAQAATCGALIAARSNNADKATHFIKLWGKGYLQYPANYMLEHLLSDSLTAEYLLGGMLQPVFDLTKDACRQYTQAIADKLAERMQSGRTLAYGNLAWEQLLRKISALAISQNTFVFPDEIIANNYLGKPPATINAISEAEKRLQVTLPEDYKQFLLASNGFECFSDIGVTILPIEEVDYLMNVDTPHVEARTRNPEIYNTGFGEKLSNSIIIGGILEEQQLLLIPLGSQQLECWYLPGWESGETFYPGFRFYMEEELQKLESGFYKDPPF